jgi:hypothetical protein
MAPTVTEVAIFNLKKEYTNEELANNAKHKKCLETVKAAKGCKGVTWGVLEEDPKQLVWLVGKQYSLTVRDYTLIELTSILALTPSSIGSSIMPYIHTSLYRVANLG